MQTIRILFFSLIALAIAGCGGDGSVNGEPSPSGGEGDNVAFIPGLLFPNGIEPGEPDDCEATAPNRCWWVDADAPDGGDGSFALPYNSFETVVGFRTVGAYTPGLITGGDHLYLKGTFDAANHVTGSKSIQLYFGRPDQSGTKSDPTVVKSYKGEPRAVFDGKFLRLTSLDTAVSGLVHIATSSSTPFNAIHIQNIEVKNAYGLGISFVENVLYADVAGVVVHDTALRDGSSSRGGIHFRMSENKPEFIVRNSLFYNNFRNEDGVGFFTGSSNNIGGINILTDEAVENGSKITIQNNILLNEFYAIRHKKSGNIETEVVSNIIDTAIMGFYIRGYRNNIFLRNLVRNISDSVIYLDAENQKGSMAVTVLNNTVTESVRFINTGFEDVGLPRTLDVRNNIFSSTVERFPIALSRDPSNDDYDLNQWSSQNNLFNISGTTILKNKGTEYNFADSMTQLGDTTSFQGDPLFVNPVGTFTTPITDIAAAIVPVIDGNYSLSTGSPAINAGSDGNNIGAL